MGLKQRPRYKLKCNSDEQLTQKIQDAEKKKDFLAQSGAAATEISC